MLQYDIIQLDHCSLETTQRFKPESRMLNSLRHIIKYSKYQMCFYDTVCIVCIVCLVCIVCTVCTVCIVTVNSIGLDQPVCKAEHEMNENELFD